MMEIDPVSGRYYTPGDPVSLMCARFAEISYQGGEARRRNESRKPHWWNRRARLRDLALEREGLEAISILIGRAMSPNDGKGT